MEKSKNVPKIRFKEFHEEWEEKEFSNTFSPLNNNTLSRAELNYEKGSTKNVHYGDVLIKFGENLDVAKEELPYITNEEIVKKYTLLQDGDIIIADAAEDETVGKCTELLNVLNERIIAGLHTIACRPLFSFANGYLGYFLNAPIYHNQLLPLMQGTKVVGISKSAIKDTIIYYPEIEEQTQIGNFFQNIDKLIETNQSKLDKLKNIKKACLEKMFPKKGSTVPEIRFKGFTEEWEEKELNTICSYLSSSLSTNDGCEEGQYELYDANGVIGYISSNVQEDDYISIIKDGSGVGRTRLLPKNSNFIGTMGGIKANDNADIYFLWCIFLNINFQKHIVGATIPHVYYSDYGLELVYMPKDLNEQKQIGTLFKNLDNLIDKNEQQLTKLKNIKKACLEKMFVNQKEVL